MSETCLSACPFVANCNAQISNTEAVVQQHEKIEQTALADIAELERLATTRDRLGDNTDRTNRWAELIELHAAVGSARELHITASNALKRLYHKVIEQAVANCTNGKPNHKKTWLLRQPYISCASRSAGPIVPKRRYL